MAGITIKGKLKKKIRSSDLDGLGFTSVSSKGNSVRVEKTREIGLQQEPVTDFSVLFRKDGADFEFSVLEGETEEKRLIQLSPMLLDLLKICGNAYAFDPLSFYDAFEKIFSSLSNAVDVRTVDLMERYEALKEKHELMEKRYEKLALSSEENSRILLEREQKIEELENKVEKLRGLGDEMLKRELFKWLKLHDGEINVAEFCAVNSLPSSRAEEGLEMLMREGYIKRKV